MKSVDFLKAIGGVAAVVFALNVYAQASDAAAPAAAPAASSKAANRALVKKVRKALAHAKGLEPTRIYTKAVDGVVTLTGSVPEQGQVDIATQAAQSVEGVSSVSNKLTVRSNN
ncbi:BON domain-containing protein [Pararobbsia silviterrae]|uniref:BON domain-containing protein n=1 Tax=Pararobbsia silviterrae TaxID=1792498 RepID=A0A494Y987_9BURK|nr:BON domain-containing protein [Pararobbsia silviterrae]RKP59211.1 BON domain-containing protein [Pararobbsia silviterrae]